MHLQPSKLINISSPECFKIISENLTNRGRMHRNVRPLCMRVLPEVSFVWKLPVALYMWVLPTASFVWILQVPLYMWVLLAVSFVWILQVSLYMRVLPAVSFVWILPVALSICVPPAASCMWYSQKGGYWNQATRCRWFFLVGCFVLFFIDLICFWIVSFLFCFW
jgi:hypothetical protein